MDDIVNVLFDGGRKMSVPRYWRESRYRYRLVGTLCLSCGRRFYPPRKVCPICHRRNMREIKLPELGEVISYTIIHIPPKGYEKYSPYAVAIIKLEDGTKVIGQLTDVKLSEIKVGMKVEAVFRKVRENESSGIIEYGIKFRPLLTDSTMREK